MDPTTKWLVRIVCIVFLGGVIAYPIMKDQEKKDKYCLKVAGRSYTETGKDCRKDPSSWGYLPD